jgi:hypothetical protein
MFAKGNFFRNIIKFIVNEIYGGYGLFFKAVFVGFISKS